MQCIIFFFFRRPVHKLTPYSWQFTADRCWLHLCDLFASSSYWILVVAHYQAIKLCKLITKNEKNSIFLIYDRNKLCQTIGILYISSLDLGYMVVYSLLLFRVPSRKRLHLIVYLLYCHYIDTMKLSLWYNIVLYFLKVRNERKITVYMMPPPV